MRIFRSRIDIATHAALLACGPTTAAQLAVYSGVIDRTMHKRLHRLVQQGLATRKRGKITRTSLCPPFIWTAVGGPLPPWSPKCGVKKATANAKYRERHREEMREKRAAAKNARSQQRIAEGAEWTAKQIHTEGRLEDVPQVGSLSALVRQMVRT